MSKKPNTTETPSQLAKAAIFAKLSRLKIASVDITYDGCGDGGCIETLTAFGADKRELTLPDKPVAIQLVSSTWDTKTTSYNKGLVKRTVPLREAIENWCYDLLEEHFAGWENNEGSDGTITINVLNKTVVMHHDENVMQTINHKVEV